MDTASPLRHTFAIIAHPDAGKTTLTEKLLLYSGALHMAGAIKARKAARHAVSDWMAMEQERGISITSTVLSIDHDGHRLNLVDTPGHADFSEDTYRTLAAVDSAIMLMDVMKGVEDRTRRLFEVCRMRHMPIISFINKMDRPGRDPFDLMDEVARTLGVKVCALNWPIGSGQEFRGVVDLASRTALLYERTEGGAYVLDEKQISLDDPALREHLGERPHDELMEQLDLLEAGDHWDEDAYLAGELTPFFFGSAMTNFGIGPLLKAILKLAPGPRPRATSAGERRPEDPEFSGFVFKIQANMNPRHRDRIAFLRVVSGRFDRGMDAVIARSGKTLRLSKPHAFMGADRELLDEAEAGDIVGLFDPGELRIGDTLAAKNGPAFEGIPRFAPEHFARLKLRDPSRRKQLGAGLTQLSQEGAIQLFYRDGLGVFDPYLGAVGLLQFEVLRSRLATEYGVESLLESSPFAAARWLDGDVEAASNWIRSRSDLVLVTDRDERPVVLTPSVWTLQFVQQYVPGVRLLEISPL